MVVCCGDRGDVRYHVRWRKKIKQGLYYTEKNWKDTFETKNLKPIDRVTCSYPAFVRTDILHDVHFNSCDKGKDRILLSYPIYNHTWEQIVDRFKS